MRISKTIITGGGSGIGLALAKKLLAENCDVLICGRSIEKLKKVQNETASDKLHIMDWDVNDISALNSKLLEARSLLGGWFDGVVQCAGIYRHIFLNVSEDVYDDLMDINLKAVFFITQRVCQYFQQNHIKGNICNVSSCVGDIKATAHTPYALSKMACTELTRAFGVAVAHQGIIINGVAPGVTRTPMIPTGGEINLFRRASTPEEIADVMMFLLSKQGESVAAETVLANAVMR
jgi:NAD(P)-dependent dehydrogenase (short-subunit alcohol dehydrogenase family)